MSRPRLLDLFCGAGGCSVGYHRAGFEVVGVDIEPHPDYPFQFVQGDAVTLLRDRAFLAGYDAIHASPPCKSENPLRHLHDVEHPDLLTPTLAALRGQDRPWIVENVSGTTKLPGALLLCGEAFGLGATCRDGVYRPLKRHRVFESSEPLMGPGCACSGRQPVGVYGHGGSGNDPARRRGYQGDKAEASQAMGIDWMTMADLSQAIPPAYTEFLGEQLLHALQVAA